MTAYRRHLPLSLACLISLSAGSAAYAAGGSALDPYITVQAPKTLKSTEKSKTKKGLGGLGHVPFIKAAHEADQKITVKEEPEVDLSETHVQMAGGKSRLVKKPVVVAEKQKKAPPKSTLVELPPVQEKKVQKDQKDQKDPRDQKVSSAAKSGSSDNVSVTSGIKAIGAGYSQTFKAVTHAMGHSTKAASDAMLAGSKKMGSGIKSGARASGDVFKKGADMVGLGGDKKDSPAAATKVAKADPVQAAPAVKAPVKAAPEKPIAVAEKISEPKAKDGDKPGIVAKLTHFPKPKMPKIGIPFVGGKKKPAVDKMAGASETGVGAEPDTNLADAPKKKQTPIAKAPLQTPIGEELPESALRPDPGPQSKVKSPDGQPKLPQGGLANNNLGGSTNKFGKLWPFGKKKQPSDINGNMQGVAGKPHFQVPM